MRDTDTILDEIDNLRRELRDIVSRGGETARSQDLQKEIDDLLKDEK